MHIIKHFDLTNREVNQILPSRQSKAKVIPLFSTEIYVRVANEISVLRKVKFLEDLPKTKKIGVFFISEKDLTLLKQNKSEIIKEIRTRFKKYTKTRKSRKR